MKIKIYDNFDIWPGGDHICEFKPGTTVLVGRNGAGKSSTLLSVREHCRSNDIKYKSFDNLIDGGTNFGDSILHLGSGNLTDLATFSCSSEGQRIIQAFGKFVQSVGQSIHELSLDSNHNEFVIMLDAVDSGMSIDNIRDVKNLFNLIKEDCDKSNIYVYIIIAANSYEFAKDLDCIDVVTGEHIWFEDYDNYANFICKGN